jgi:hypothetical protein
MITLYKAVTGAASCGCFGSVHVNPWITLFAIDLPALLALSIFRPKPVLPPRILVRIRLRHRPVKALIRQLITPLPSAPRFAMTICLALAILGVTTPIFPITMGRDWLSDSTCLQWFRYSWFFKKILPKNNDYRVGLELSLIRCIIRD